MLYFYYGTNIDKVRAKARVTVDALLKKRPDATLVKIGDEDISIGHLHELTSSQALFANKYIVLFSKSFTNKDTKELVLKHVKEIAASENIFIFVEGKTDKTSIAKIEKVAEKTEEFAKPENLKSKEEKLAEIGEKIDFFEFADALGSRNKKRLWILYQDALREEVPSEEVHGIFFWQMKSMLSATKCNTAEEAGMKPFPFSKARQYARNYKDGELEKISGELISMYHEAHRGNTDFPIALEKFILSL